MPCGGIYPEEYLGFRDGDYKCLECNRPECELWCEEWDGPLHIACVAEFLQRPEGRVVLEHRHTVILEVGGPDVSAQYRTPKS